MNKVSVEGQLVCYHWSWMEKGTVHWTFEPGKNRTQNTHEILAIVPHTFVAEVPEIFVEEAQAAAQVAAFEAEKVRAAETYKRTVADIDGRLREVLATKATK